MNDTLLILIKVINESFVKNEVLLFEERNYIMTECRHIWVSFVTFVPNVVDLINEKITL